MHGRRAQAPARPPSLALQDRVDLEVDVDSRSDGEIRALRRGEVTVRREAGTRRRRLGAASACAGAVRRSGSS